MDERKKQKHDLGDKLDYYAYRAKDPKLTIGQRKYAKKKLGKLRRKFYTRSEKVAYLEKRMNDETLPFVKRNFAKMMFKKMTNKK